MNGKELRLIGTSYKVASVEARERYQKSCRDILPRLRGQSGLEMAVVATCNRFEVYLAGHSELDVPLPSEEPYTYRVRGSAAAEHLFRVATGIESAILGDMQILSQIKKARADATGPYIDRLFLTAIQAGKRARHETAIGSGRASVGSAIAGMLRERTAVNGRILILGAGDAAKAIGAHLAKHTTARLIWMNRTGAKAEELAERFGGTARPFSELEAALANCDAVVAATGAGRPILSKAMLARTTPRLVIDAGMPRNVEGGASAEVVNIDAIREQQTEVLTERRAAIPAVEQIVADALDAWGRWVGARATENVIRSLFAEVQSSARDAAAAIASEPEADIQKVEEIVERSIKRLLHEPVRALRALQ